VETIQICTSRKRGYGGWILGDNGTFYLRFLMIPRY
jgi:hypothetical protein